MNPSRSATSSRSRRGSARKGASDGAHENQSMPAKVQRDAVLWSTDPMRKQVSFGPVPQLLNTRTITWYAPEHEMVVTSVAIYNDQGEEATEFRTAFAGATDPILLHRLHRLIGALKHVDVHQMLLATSAVTNGTPYVLQNAEIDPAEAEEQLRNQLADGYDTAINHLSDDVPRDIAFLRECGLEVSTVLVTEECIAGRLEFTQKLADLGVTSPEHIRARDAARAALLEPLKPFIDQLIVNHKGGCDCRKLVESAIIDLASRGIVDNDLLLAYGLTVFMHGKVSPVMGFANMLVGGLLGGHFRGPDVVGIAARQIKQLMPDSVRDEQWTRWALAGIQHDLEHGLLDVKRTDLR